MAWQMFRVSRTALAVLLPALCILAVTCVPALAVTEAPGWQTFTRDGPTNMQPGGTGLLQLYTYNTGAGVSGEATLVDKLPSQLTVAPGVGGDGSCSGVGTH